jgi:hypothetical protein
MPNADGSLMCKEPLQNASVTPAALLVRSATNCTKNGLASLRVQVYRCALRNNRILRSKERQPLANDSWGQQLHDAIARRDAVRLRRMAAAADSEEVRMWLTLLSRMLQLDTARRRRRTMRAAGRALEPARRLPIRRAL